MYARIFILFLWFAISWPVLGQGNDFPRREITLMVGFAPGGSEDLRARGIAPKLSQFLGQPVVVVNRAGASGTIMLGQLAKAAPDGYTLGSLSTSPMIFSPHTQQVQYHPDDFTYLGGSSLQPSCICVAKDAPWKNMEQLLAYAKANPGKVNYAVPGIGHQSHLMMELVDRAQGVKTVAIPFKGDVEAINAMLGGHVPVGSFSGTFVPHAKEGRMRALMVFSDTRLKNFPDVPTSKELGIQVDTRLAAALGYGGPKGLPPEVQRKLEAAFEYSIKSPEFANVVEQLDGEVLYRNGATFGVQMRELYEATGKRLKELGL